MESVTELLFSLVLLETYNLARKAAILAAEDKSIDSNIETDYEKPRKRQLPVRFTQSSDDDDWESENMPNKRKRQVARGSREMQRTESEEHEKCQNISQKKGVPAPAANIREQLAALKVKISHPIKALKCDKMKSNTKQKVLSTKKPMKAVNEKMSCEKSPTKGKK